MNAVVRVEMPASEGGPYDAIVARDASSLRAALEQRFGTRTRVLVADRALERREIEAAVGATAIEVPGGEALKSLTAIEALCGQLIEARVDRGTVICALGGGALGDAVGFCAATLLRGVDYVHLPTTLLSMVDSSIGGKTGVNLLAGKNLVGAFHQPRLVYADLSRLATLDARDRAAGLGEVCKHALLQGEHALGTLERDAEALRDGTIDALFDVVKDAVAYKARVVAADPRERKGEGEGPLEGRITLNLGHTIGHALERASHDGEDPLRHGEAVALGLVAEAQLEPARWPEGPARLAELLPRLGLTRTLPDTLRTLSRETLVSALRADKKNARGAVRVVLLDGPGRPVLARLDADEMVEMLLARNGMVPSTSVEAASRGTASPFGHQEG